MPGLRSTSTSAPATVPFSDTLLGAWTLTFRNGPDSVVGPRPTCRSSPGDPSAVPPGASPPCIPVSVTSPAGGAADDQLRGPDGFSPSAIRFVIYDKDDRLPNGGQRHPLGRRAGLEAIVHVPEVLSRAAACKRRPVRAEHQLIETRDPPSLHEPAIPDPRRSSSFFTFTAVQRRRLRAAAFLPTVGRTACTGSTSPECRKGRWSSSIPWSPWLQVRDGIG